MIEVRSPFPDINQNPRILDEFYLESGRKQNFSLRKRLYYSVLRPILPLPLRQKLQKKYLVPKKEYPENFIDARLVDLVLENPDNKKRTESFYPDGHRAAIILTHDVETQEGFDHILPIVELEKSLGFKSSWNIVPYKYRIDRGIVDAIRDAGHEIGIHGYNHDGKLYYSQKIFRERAQHINRAIDEFGAVGFRSPAMHRNLEWLQELDITYDASTFDCDPFQPFPGGTGSIWPFTAGKFVELPYTLPQDHTLFYILGERDISIWKNKVRWLMETRGMILSVTHPDYLGERKHLDAYRDFLDFLKSLSGLWHCLPMEMAERWKNLSSEAAP